MASGSVKILKDCEAGRYFELPSGKVILGTWKEMQADYEMKQFQKQWMEDWPFLWVLIKISLPESPIDFVPSPRIREGELLEDVSDIYSLTKMDLLIHTSLQDTGADKLLAAIEASKTRPLSKVLTGLGLPGLGRTWCRKLAERYKTIQALTHETWQATVQVPGLGHIRASALHTWCRTEGTHRVIEKLKVAGLTALQDTPDASEASSSVSRVSGKTFMFTGRMEVYRRQQAQEIIEELGGIAGSGVSSKTDYLVVGEKPGSKLGIALHLGVPRITENEFLEMIREVREVAKV